MICGALGEDTLGVPAERLDDLHDHERYLFQVIHGTINKDVRVPEELVCFLEDVVGNEVVIVDD